MGEFRMPLAPRTVALLAAGLVAFVVVAFAVATSVYSVPADSEAVVLRFGRYRSTELPGLHGKLPFGMDRARIVPVKRVHSMEFGFHTVQPGRRTQYRVTPQQKEAALTLTGDLNMASVDWVVQYRVRDAKAYLFKVQEVEDTIRNVSEAVMNALVGDRSVDEVITTGREELAAEAREKTQKVLDGYDCGIDLVALTLQDATPPDPVKDAFDAVNRARQEKDRIKNQAKAERNRLIPAARGAKERKIKEADGYRAEKIRTAQGEAKALLARYEAYEKNPEETRLRLFMEAMEVVYQQAGRKIIVDPEVKGILPLLDLGSAAKGGAR